MDTRVPQPVVWLTVSMQQRPMPLQELEFKSSKHLKRTHQFGLKWELAGHKGTLADHPLDNDDKIHFKHPINVDVKAHAETWEVWLAPAVRASRRRWWRMLRCTNVKHLQRTMCTSTALCTCLTGVFSVCCCTLFACACALRSIQLRQTQRRPGLPCSSGGVFANRFSCAFALVFAVPNVCVCVCVFFQPLSLLCSCLTVCD